MMFQQEFTIPAGIGGVSTHHFYQLKNLSTRYEAWLKFNMGKRMTRLSILSRLKPPLRNFGDADFSIVEEATLRAYQETDPNGFIEVAYRFPTPIDPNNTGHPRSGRFQTHHVAIRN